MLPAESGCHPSTSGSPTFKSRIAYLTMHMCLAPFVAQTVQTKAFESICFQVPELHINISISARAGYVTARGSDCLHQATARLYHSRCFVPILGYSHDSRYYKSSTTCKNHPSHPKLDRDVHYYVNFSTYPPEGVQVLLQDNFTARIHNSPPQLRYLQATKQGSITQKPRVQRRASCGNSSHWAHSKPRTAAWGTCSPM